MKDDGDSFSNFKKFIEFVMKVFSKLGVNVELSGCNDILVEGRKILGNV